MSTNTSCNMCNTNKSKYIILNCIHFICTDCSRGMLQYQNDWVMQCFCNEITPVNIVAQIDDLPLPDLVIYFLFLLNAFLFLYNTSNL
jgi:hypothetical protein